MQLAPDLYRCFVRFNPYRQQAISIILRAPGRRYVSSTVDSPKLFESVRSIHHTILAPLNKKLMGPLEHASDQLVPLPMVFVLGNHSSGKSTFINFLTGRRIQETGVAPTDDGFTVISAGSIDTDQDGPVRTQSSNFGGHTLNSVVGELHCRPSLATQRLGSQACINSGPI